MSLEFRDTKALECCKKNLLGNSSGSPEGLSVHSNLDTEECVHVVSENKDLLRN